MVAVEEAGVAAAAEEVEEEVVEVAETRDRRRSFDRLRIRLPLPPLWHHRQSLRAPRAEEVVAVAAAVAAEAAVVDVEEG